MVAHFSDPAIPGSPTSSITPKPILLPWVKNWSSEIHEPVKQRTFIPDSPIPTKDQDAPESGTQMETSYVIPSTAHVNDKPNTDNMSSIQTTYTRAHNDFKGIVVSGSGKQQFGTERTISQALKQPIATTDPTKNVGYKKVTPSTVDRCFSEPLPNTNHTVTPSTYSSMQRSATGIKSKPIISDRHDQHETNVNEEHTATTIEKRSDKSSRSGQTGLMNKAAGPKPSLTSEGPTRTTSRNNISSPSLRDPSLKSIRPVSPLIRTPKRAPCAPKRPYIRHHLLNPSPTPPRPPPPTLAPTPPRASSPTHKSRPLFDPLIIATPSQPYASASSDPPHRSASTSQEKPSPPAKPNASTSAVHPQKRPASPEMRPARLLRRQRRRWVPR